MKNGIALLAVAGVAAVANAQNGLSFQFPGGNTYSGGAPVVVELWASFGSQYYSFAGFGGSVNSDASGEFANPALTLKNDGNDWPGTTAGVAAGGNVTGIVAGQAQFTGLFNSNTANPVKIWEAEWSTSDLTERTVDLSTILTKFDVFTAASGSSAALGTAATNASGTIEVVPAPASLALLGLGGLAAGRRRR